MDGWLTYPANSTRFEDAERSLSSDTITASSASHSNRTGIPKSADYDKHQIEMQVLDRGDSANSNDKDGLILRALGKKQLLHRNFGFISMVGFISSMMATWETEGFVIQGGLLNGGPVALVYGFILCFIGNLATSASIAELASIFPTAGGQYHFVALLCPRPCREFLSWLAGRSNSPMSRSKTDGPLKAGYPFSHGKQ
jgi:amino acid permease